MGFDSKRDLAPPTILLGLLPCLWMWGISSQPLQCLPSYWGFSDLGCGVSPHSQSSKAQQLLQTLNVGYLLMAAPVKHSSGSVSGSWCTQSLFEPSEHLWWVWGLILNMISPLLPSFWGFSFSLGHGLSFFWWDPIFSSQWLFSSEL